MRESNWEYDQRMQKERHSLTIGGNNRFSIPMKILDLWSYYGTPNPNSKKWNKFVKEIREIFYDTKNNRSK